MDATPQEPQTLGSLLQTYNKRELARRLGVDASTVARWGRGETSPDTIVLPKLAALIRVDLDELTRLIAQEAEAKR